MARQVVRRERNPMNIFGVGPLEIVLVLILVLIIFGPKDIEKAGKSIGKGLNKLVRSESWQTVQKTGRELKNLPGRLMRESGIEDFEKSTRSEFEKTNAALNQSISTLKNEIDQPPSLPKQPVPPSLERPADETDQPPTLAKDH